MRRPRAAGNHLNRADASYSRLELVPLYRPGGRSGGTTVAERWSWDFAVDGRPLAAAVGGDIAGALDWGEPAWGAGVVEKLLGRAGLVRARRAGREVRYHVRPERLDETARWMTRLASEWDARPARSSGSRRARRLDDLPHLRRDGRHAGGWCDLCDGGALRART